MAPDDRPGVYDESYWRRFLENPDTFLTVGRRLFARIPHGPRCRLCAAPFQGPGAPLMRLIGKRPSDGNPTLCNTCANVLLKHHGGAEVVGSMLFADIRGSTALAERMSIGEFHALLDRFYSVAAEAVFSHDGIVDKFVGDEVVAVFPPMLGDGRHASRAIEAATALLEATGHRDPAGPWAPVGAGVNTGKAWFGVVGEGERTDLTVVGDSVNTTARLAGVARLGEIIVTTEAATAAGLDPGLERRSLELKGKQMPTEVVTLRVAPA